MQSVLAGRYRLERQLGKGGMGSVWLAEHLALRSWVAVKLMDPAIAATPEGAERFRREAMAAASLRSAHVVQVLDYGVHETTPYLVMELMNGESLAGCLEREKRLTPERTVAIMTQVARALGRAHAAGIVHRDLKPDNVFLVREDDQELVKILDFGIAKTPASTFGGMETKTGVTMGTPYYMSPEQVEGKKAVDFRTDLWAMAVITSECMTGVRPFDGSTYGELLLNICARPIAPPSSQGFSLRGFDEWFAKATSRDAEQRFSSAQELVNALRDVVAGTAAVFAPPSAVASSGQPAYFPGGTGQGAAPSVSSMNTSQALDELRVPTKASPLPWLLLGVVLLLGGGWRGGGAAEAKAGHREHGARSFGKHASHGRGADAEPGNRAFARPAGVHRGALGGGREASNPDEGTCSGRARAGDRAGAGAGQAERHPPVLQRPVLGPSAPCERPRAGRR